MKELLDKFSSYNIFNYLFPGVVFVILLSKTTQYDFILKDIVVGVFLYYFIGLTISRVGSLIIEPILKKFHFIILLEYSRFVKVSKEDSKLNMLSEVNNMYRTICSMLLIESVFVIYEKIAQYCTLLQVIDRYLLLLSLFALFIFSYRKQTKYICKRIEANENP
jgi:hypothetical protein